jgi:hypothetical protein
MKKKNILQGLLMLTAVFCFACAGLQPELKKQEIHRLKILFTSNTLGSYEPSG